MNASSCGYLFKHLKNVHLSSNSMLCTSSYWKIFSARHLPMAGMAYDLVLISSSRNYSSIIHNDVLSYNPFRFSQRILASTAACKSPADARNLHSSTSVVTSSKNKVGDFLKNLFKSSKYGNATLNRSGYSLYDSLSLNTDVLHFFKVLSLEDSFFSWFLVSELQVWLLSARLGAEGEDGRTVRNGLINAFWEDVHARIKVLGERPLNKNRQIDELNSHFQTSLVGYDEGLLSCDRTLACAVWRNLIRREKGDTYYEDDVENSSADSNNSSDESKVNLDALIVKPTADPRALEAVVCYIRKQMYILDQIPSEELLGKGKATWTKLEAIS